MVRELGFSFQTGLNVRVVAYQNDDRESREAWNTAKHDEESNTVRWSTLYQKVSTAYASMTRAENRDWKHATTRLLNLYGPGKKSTVARWIRAAKGMHDTLRDELKKHPTLKGTYLWDNSFLIFSPSEARKHLPPNYAINALRMVAERSDTEHFSAKRFENEILKPMNALVAWENL